MFLSFSIILRFCTYLKFIFQYFILFVANGVFSSIGGHIFQLAMQIFLNSSSGDSKV